MKVLAGHEEAFAHYEERCKMFGAGSLLYAKTLADVLEERFARGLKFEDVIDEAVQVAGRAGITGTQFGLACGVLVQFWDHGVKIARWKGLKRYAR